MKPNNSLRIPTARFEVTPPGGPPVTEMVTGWSTNGR